MKDSLQIVQFTYLLLDVGVLGIFIPFPYGSSAGKTKQDNQSWLNGNKLGYTDKIILERLQYERKVRKVTVEHKSVRNLEPKSKY